MCDAICNSSVSNQQAATKIVLTSCSISCPTVACHSSPPRTSINLAYAFEEYFGALVSCPKHEMNDGSDHSVPLSEGSQETRQRLKSIISPEGLAILAKHVPSLRLGFDVQLPSMITSLFGKLLQTYSKKGHPFSYSLLTCNGLIHSH